MAETYDETGREQVILAITEKTEQLKIVESREQVVLATVEGVDLATFGEIREQVALATIEKAEQLVIGETGREQVVSAVIEKGEQLTMVETSRSRPDQRYHVLFTIDHDLVGITQLLASNASSGQKDVVIQKGATYGVGDSVVIKDSGNREVGTVASVADNTVTLEDNLTNAYTTANGAWLKNVTDSTDSDIACLFTERDMPTTFWTNVKADGTDIVVYLPTGVKLKRELVAGSWDRAGHTMELHARIPEASTTVDTEVQLWYGYAAGAETNDTDTWDEHYKFVSHMNDDPDTGHIKDSTSNGNDGTKLSANNPIEVAGSVGKAQEFSEDSIDLGDPASLQNANAITLESLFNPAISQPNYAGLLTAFNSYALRRNTTDVIILALYIDSGWRYSPAVAYDVGSYNYFTGTYDSSTRTLKIYKNGVYQDETVLSGLGNYTIEDNNVNVGVGAYWGVSWIRKFNGLIDETCASNIARTPSWISTTHNTLMRSDVFYTVGAEVDHEMVMLAVVGETDLATFNELAHEQVVLAVVEKTDLATFSDAHEQVVLVVATETDLATFGEAREQVILTVIEEADLATFNEAREQVILAIGSETDLATFTDTHEQVVLVVCTGNATAPTAIETGLTQVILVVTGESDFYIHPEYAAGFVLEIRDSSDNLLAVLKDAYGITLEETVNAPKVLSFMIPADNAKLINLTRANELWVRNMKTNTVISKTRLTRRDDARN